MKAYASDKTRTFLLRLEDGETLPEALTAALHAEGVASGWVRATGVLHDVVLRSYDAATGGLGASRTIEGPLLAVHLEGAIGMADGSPAVALRGSFARERDVGLDTFAGELVSARVTGLDALVTALDDVAVALAHDVRAGVALLGGAGEVRAARPTTARVDPPRAEPKRDAGWAAAADASAHAEPPRAAPVKAVAETAPIPPRPVRPQADEVDTPLPEAGDFVEHFAFGRCEVLKSDGDRLHLKVHKDGRIREIALEMLKVVPQESSGPHRFFRLLRKM